MRADEIRNLYANFPQNSGWYLPLGEVTADRVNDRLDELSGLSGLVLEPYRARYYFDGGVAPHVLGYMGAINESELADFVRQGYRPDDRVGISGLEKWGEKYLAGKRGGALYVFNSQRQPVTRLAETPAKSGESIYTTLDRDFQTAVQDAVQGFRGSVVVLERDTGKVLAMVSSPGFDPNAFEPVNYNSESLLGLLNNQDRPLLNRATQGLYPLGSVFKTIVMAAALESGLYTPESSLQCGYTFDELGPDFLLYDWTYEYFQQDGKTKPSGLLTLSQGLMRSCNPWFYHIGLDLFNNGKGSLISDLAKGFGLGSLTGIEGVAEEAGNVPVPASEIDATNLGIGQGELLVTPLQVANFMAAIGNGGTLYRPQIVDRIIPPEGDPIFSFKPEVLGKLPIKSSTLSAVHEALVGVIRSTKPTGTAWHQFTGLDINVAGKTGTATSGYDLPHAWFAGYTFEQNPDKPDIAIAVVLDNAGEGSVYAAPIFRRIVELYFNGQPQKLYDWETSYGVIRTPEP
jgi:cell division protein FtsI/penicillin-binding protein 2